MKKMFLAAATALMLSAGPAFASFEVNEGNVAGAVGGGATGVTASGAVGSVAGVSLTTSAAVGAGYAIVIDILVNGDKSLASEAWIAACGGHPRDAGGRCDMPTLSDYAGGR